MNKEDSLFTIKMRAANNGSHISGAERILDEKNLSRVSACLVERALNHSKGFPDFINVKIEKCDNPDVIDALEVTTVVTNSVAESYEKIKKILSSVNVSRVDEIMSMFSETYAMRGAMLLDADTLERLEPDRERGIRATYMDDASSIQRKNVAEKNHYMEAIVLATKVQNAPGIIAEICVSDDPDYVTGYVATKQHGYVRLTTIKEKGSPNGGRIFLYRGKKDDVARTIEYLEKKPVLVRGIENINSKGMQSKEEFLKRELDRLKKEDLYRQCKTIESPTSVHAQIEGKELLVFSSNDYLGLASHPRVVSASVEMIKKWGVGSGGSRLTTGTRPLNVELESCIAKFKGTESALVWATGYMANVGTISAFVGKDDYVFSDSLNHASIIDGCKLSGANIVVYKHNDMADLEKKLSDIGTAAKKLVVSDAVFSMDGDILDLPRFIDICVRYGAWSMIDEAHSTGVLGATGRGICEYFGCKHPDIIMGTLSKAIGSEGGFVAGSKLLIEYLINKSRSFIFSTAPDMAALAASIESFRMLIEDSSLVRKLNDNIALFRDKLAESGIFVNSQSPIIPLIIGDEKKAMDISHELSSKGLLIPAIRYPTVARGEARLRITISATHSENDIIEAANIIASCIK